MLNFKLYDNLRDEVEDEGFKWFDSGSMDLNFVGKRSMVRPGTFDDMFFVAYKVNGSKRVHEYQGTTDPGNTAPIRIDGLAIAIQAQTIGAYERGKHNGRDALKQRKEAPLPYVRIPADRIKEYFRGGMDLNQFEVHRDHIGLNHHDSGAAGRMSQIETRAIGNWSLGCQVAYFKEDILMTRYLLERQAAITKTSTLSYTLLDKKWKR